MLYSRPMPTSKNLERKKKINSAIFTVFMPHSVDYIVLKKSKPECDYSISSIVAL